MRVHARNVAVAAGAVDNEVDQVAKAISRSGTVSIDAAHGELRQVRLASAASDDTDRIRARFKALRAAYMPRIMTLIEEVVGQATPERSSLVEMCHYHLETGGKRLRALLPLLVAETLEDYFTMVEGKTSGLFAPPMAGAAALCGTPPQVVDGLQEAARHMGVLFQIQDDLLDLYFDKGRDMRGNDIREGKRSVLVVHALNSASPADPDRLQGVLDRPREQTSAEDVAQVVELLQRAGSLDFALRELELRKERARQIPALQAHPQLRSVVAAMCELFSEPIQPLIARRAENVDQKELHFRRRRT